VKRILLTTAVFGLLFQASCKKTPTCEVFAEKIANCRTKDKDKAAVMAERVKGLCKASELKFKKDPLRMKWLNKARQCANKGTCEEFKKCDKEVSKARRIALLPSRLKKDKDKILAFAKEGKYKKALSRCTFDYSAKRGLEVEDKTAKKAAQDYYTFCKKQIPGYLEKIRDAGTAGSYFGFCYSLRRKTKPKRPRFLDRANFSEAELTKLKGICSEISLGKTISKIEKDLAKNVSRGRFSYHCYPKRIEKLGSEGHSAKMLNKIKDLCYKQLGYKILVAKKVKLAKKRYKYCGYTEKYIAKGFKKFNLGGAEHKATLDFFYKLCRI